MKAENQKIKESKTHGDQAIWAIVALAVLGAILAVLYVARKDVKKAAENTKKSLDDMLSKIKIPEIKLPDLNIDLPDIKLPEVKPVGSCENLSGLPQALCKALTGQNDTGQNGSDNNGNGGGNGGGGNGGGGILPKIELPVLNPIGSCENLPSVLQGACKTLTGQGGAGANPNVNLGQVIPQEPFTKRPDTTDLQNIMFTPAVIAEKSLENVLAGTQRTYEEVKQDLSGIPGALLSNPYIKSILNIK